MVSEHPKSLKDGIFEKLIIKGEFNIIVSKNDSISIDHDFIGDEMNQEQLNKFMQYSE